VAVWVPLVYDEIEKVDRLTSPPNTFLAWTSQADGRQQFRVSVYNCNTRMIVAKFWDAYHFPERFADLVAFAGLWFGGTTDGRL